MSWTIVITGIDCDEQTIVRLRSKLMSVATVENTGSLTLEQWLFDAYWRQPERMEPRLNGDVRLIASVLG